MSTDQPLPTKSPDDKWVHMERKAQTVSLMILAAATVGLTLYWLRPVLLPFVLALFFTVGLTPIFDWFQSRLRVSRLTAVAITFVCGLVMTVFLWLVVWISIASLLEDSATYHQRFSQIAANFTKWIPDESSDSVEPDKEESEAPKTEYVDEDAVPIPPADTVEAPAAEATDQVRRQKADRERSEKMAQFTSQYINYAITQLYSGLSELLGMTVMVSIFMFFLLLGNTSQNIHQLPTWREIETKIRSYIVTKTVISIFTGIAFGAVLWFYGVPLSVVFALLAFLLNLIPNVGPLIACALPVPLILLDPNLSIPGMIMVLVLTSAVQFVSGNIVEPKVMGDSFALHPIAILLTLMLWGIIWGLPGMFLATPLTAAAKILFEKFEMTKPISDLLEGKWPSATPPA
jgi:AI-2 transport protein TqsA